MTALVESGFRLPQVVDSTILDTMRVCAAKFAFSHGRGLASPTKPVDLVAGGAFAAARQALYKSAYAGRLRPVALDAAREAFLLEWGDFALPDGSKSPKTLARTWELLVDYAHTFDPPNDRLAPATHLVDPPFEWPFAISLDRETLGTDYDWPKHPSGEWFTYAGRIDAPVTCGGLTIVLDDKTTSRFASVDVWVAGLQMRAQFIGYVDVVARKLDATCDSAVVRQGAIRSSGVEWRESPLLPVSKHLRAVWLRTTRDTLERMVALNARDEWPAVLSDACVAWSRPCAFLDACRSRDPEPHLAGFAVRRWNPLDGTESEA